MDGGPSVFASGTVAVTLLVGVLTYALYQFVVLLLYSRRMCTIFKDLPGPKDVHWFYGHIHLLPKTGHERIKFGLGLLKQFPRFYRFWTGIRPNIVLNHPETVKIVLKTAEPKPTGFGGSYRHGLPWLGEGLLIAKGSRWARSRRLLTPAFHFDVLRPYISIYNEAVEQLLDNIDKYADSGESFELFRVISACTLDIILRCAFSYNTQCQNTDGKPHPYVTAVTEISEIWTHRNRSPWLYPDILFYLSPKGWRFMKQCRYVHKVAEDVIDQRKKTLDEGGVMEKKYKDFLDILLMAKDENGIGLTREEIRNEVDTFLFEGHDTTASAISWILYSMAANPVYQSKVQEEIDSLTEGREPPWLQWDDLSKLEYLTMCIKEGMRIHGPVPFIQRQSTRKFTIDGHTFPAGTMLSINIYGVHHNGKVWEDPEEYKPERFTKENMAKMDTYSYIPFSAGPRNCIGQHFALNEEKVVLSRILQRYKIRLDPDHEVRKKGAAVMRSESGIRVMIQRRKSLL